MGQAFELLGLLRQLNDEMANDINMADDEWKESVARAVSVQVIHTFCCVCTTRLFHLCLLCVGILSIEHVWHGLGVTCISSSTNK